jgi:hypothetical protein
VITEIPPSEEFADSMLTTVALLAAFAAPAYAHHGTEPSGSSNAAPAADTYQDLRSPDARDAAIASIESGKQDVRSPDARDAGREPTTVPVPEPVVEVREVPGSGFDWGDAGIGAARDCSPCSASRAACPCWPSEGGAGATSRAPAH